MNAELEQLRAEVASADATSDWGRVIDIRGWVASVRGAWS